MKLKIAFIILLLGITSKELFLLVSPDYNFFLTPVTKQYKDKEGNVTDVDKYIEMIGKYCDYRRSGRLNYKTTRPDMCVSNDKYQTFFRTAEEYIKVLEYAKNNDDAVLYQRTYGGVNKFGVEKILEKYDDETFQAYVISKGDIDKTKEKIYRNSFKNNSILTLLNFYLDSVDKNINMMNSSLNHDVRTYWDNYKKEFLIRISNIPEINQKIF